MISTKKELFRDGEVIQHPMKILEICGSFIVRLETIKLRPGASDVSWKTGYSSPNISEVSLANSDQQYECFALAHYSVQEYLMSEHIYKFSPRYFLQPDRCRLQISQALLRCLLRCPSFELLVTTLETKHSRKAKNSAMAHI